MILNALEIKQKKIIRRAVDKNYTGASYNLSVGEIISMDGKNYEEYKIPPRGMVLIVSHELFNLPKNIVGYTTVKNGLSIDGIMAINIGIVDPEWDKPISSLIINFGNADHLIIKGDTFLRMTFHEFNRFDKSQLPAIPIYNKPSDDKDYDEYVKTRKKQSIKSLSNTFLSISQIRSDISNRVRLIFIRDFFILAAAIGILGFLLTNSKDFIAFKKQRSDAYRITLIDSLNKRIENLESKFNFEENNLSNGNIKRDTVGINVKGSLESKRK